MLATLRFWPLLGLTLTYAATINVIPASDPSVLYSSGWSQEFSQSTQTSFFQAEGIGCTLSVTLPTNASSVSYVGFPRAGGSMYGYNLDCVGDCLVRTANGSDPTVTDDANVPQSTLFTLALDPTTQHTLYVYNIPSDQADGSSQINLSNLNVALEDSNGATDVPGAGGGLPPQTNIVASASSASSPTSSASSLSVSEQASSATPTSPLSSASSTSNSLNSVSATPIDIRVSSSSSATQTDSKQAGSSGSLTTGSATPTIPVLQASSSSTADAGNANTGVNAGSSSGSGKTHGLSKSVAIGVSVLAVVFGGALIATLVVFIRQRRRRRNSYSGSAGSQPPLSPAGSIIPIMAPPQMRPVSETYAIPNPFIDPPSESPPLDIPFNSSLMQRRMEGRTSPASPAPTIPLPDLPQGGMNGRSDSPVAGYARNDLWITRSPAKPSFTVL